MVKSKVGESFKQKLFLVYFKDGFIKPVVGISREDAIEAVEQDPKRLTENIEKIVIEQNYYPMNEDYYDV